MSAAADVESLFDWYDENLNKEIDVSTLHQLYKDLRHPGIRLAQVRASLEAMYGEGMGDTLERADLAEALTELDRRFFLLQDLVWEFRVLAGGGEEVSEEDARYLFEITHEKAFSLSKYEAWRKGRIFRGCGVKFTEMDVPLCNKPTPDEIIAELPALPREMTETGIVRSATTLITDKTRSHDKKKKIEKLSYIRKLEELKAKRTQNLKQRQNIERSAAEKRSEDELKKQRDAEETKKRAAEEARRAEEREKLERLKQEAAERDRLNEEERMKLEEEERQKKDAEQKALDEAEVERKRLAEREEERKRKEEADAKRKKEEEEAAARAAKLAEEEAQRRKEKSERDLAKSKDDEEAARERMRAAEEALNAAKSAKDAAAIEEAQRAKKEADERARTLMMIKKIAEATTARSRTMLEDVIAECKKKKIQGVEEPLQEAGELLKLLNLQQRLEDACMNRSIDDIELAVDAVRAAGFEKDLALEVVEAEKLLEKLKRLAFLKRQVMELKQQTIAELKSYSQPPPMVKFVMTATFLILGHTGKELQKWPQLVVLMGKTGKDSLKRRVQGFEPDTMPWDVATACKEILSGMDTGSVADVSAGAAAFYIWCDGMVEERLSLPEVITQEIKETRRRSISREDQNRKLTRGRTVEVLSRRSRSRDVIDVPGAAKKGADRSKSRGKVGPAGSKSKSPAVRRGR